VVLDLQPEFAWTFSFECQPLGFLLTVGTSVDPQSDDIFRGNTEGSLTTYSGVELLPATWHRWRVYAQVTEGHYVGIGGRGEFVNFLSGPMCAADQLVAPELIYPADGSTYTGKSWGNAYEVEADISYPKSESGKRRIAVGKDVLELLRKHKDLQPAFGSRATADWNQHDLVFPSVTGTPINDSNLRRSFRRLLEVTNLPKIRFHDLRHTAATLMLESGIPITVVSQRLGHSKTSMTLDVYAHSTPLKQVEAAERMEELMTPIAFPVAHGLHTEAK
jgi:hypothetical protein